MQKYLWITNTVQKKSNECCISNTNVRETDIVKFVQNYKRSRKRTER